MSHQSQLVQAMVSEPSTLCCCVVALMLLLSSTYWGIFSTLRWNVYGRRPHQHVTLLRAVDEACRDITADQSPAGFVMPEGSFQDVWQVRTFVLTWMRECGQVHMTELISELLLFFQRRSCCDLLCMSSVRCVQLFHWSLLFLWVHVAPRWDMRHVLWSCMNNSETVFEH